MAARSNEEQIVTKKCESSFSDGFNVVTLKHAYS